MLYRPYLHIAIVSIESARETGRGAGSGEAKRKHALLQLPLAVVERAHIARLEPARDAVEVEGVVADAPRSVALLGGRRDLVRLAVDACGGQSRRALGKRLRLTEIHDVVPADRAVVDDDVPCPERDRVPLHQSARSSYAIARGTHLLDLEALLRLLALLLGALGLRCSGGCGGVDVHAVCHRGDRWWRKKMGVSGMTGYEDGAVTAVAGGNEARFGLGGVLML